jgi:SpoVK/Ycf46/Vps4 family AAA+-type ATPase
MSLKKTEEETFEEVTKWGDQPDEFLSAMQTEYPPVADMLTVRQLRLLSKSSTLPYPGEKKNVNEEFVEDLAAYIHTRLAAIESKKNLRNSLLSPATSDKSILLKETNSPILVMRKIEAWMKQCIDRRLEVTEKEKGEVALPRAVRLARRYKFSENETMLLYYVVADHYGVYAEFQKHDISFDRFYRGADIVTISKVMKLPLHELLSFLSPEREHMQHSIFPDLNQVYLLTSGLHLDAEVVKALFGSKLTTSEFLKVENTPLGDVLAEEAGNEYGTKGLLEPSGHPTVGDDKEPEKDSESEVDGEEPPVDQVSDLADILKLELKYEQMRKEQKETKDDSEETEETEDESVMKPYKNDLDYLDDHLAMVVAGLFVKELDARFEMDKQYDEQGMFETRYKRRKREAESKLKVAQRKCEKRMTLTRAAGGWLPRLERMAESRNLCAFEKNVLLALIAAVIQPDKFKKFDMRISSKETTIRDVLRLFCHTLEEQIQYRKYFYKSATMVHEGMINVHNLGLTGDISSATVELDRRMLDFCVGLDTEFSEVVEGSHLYHPKTKFEQVIVAQDQKRMILETVSNFETYKKVRKRLGMDDIITYGVGMVMLFYGPPGTGKTMMANALANKLNKKILLINFPSLGSMAAGENFKFIFRESKINDAILFFDECEAIFETREKGGHDVNLLLTEIERHDGLIILATNRPFDLDEAMHRRIMLAIEFLQPDHLLRKTIWESHIPKDMKIADDVDLNELANRFELTGGFIKNALLSALSVAVSRDGDNPVITHADFVQGANFQLRGRLRMKDFDRRIVPVCGLDEIIVDDKCMRGLRDIVNFEKARSVLFGQWGFGKRTQEGLTVLLHGPPGTGKTLAAEAIGYEVGRPLKVVNCGELLSKWVGESTKNIDAIFQEARQLNAILVFDEAEGLFGQRTAMTSSTDRYANVDVGVLLYHIEHFPGIVILTTNLYENIDKAFFRRLKFILDFDTPTKERRAKLWKLLIPKECPVADGVDYERLAIHEMTGGHIKSAIFRAAARAALRKEEKRILTEEDLKEACEEECGKSGTSMSFRRQDSVTQGMYN